MKVKIKSNNNFHTVTEKTVFDVKTDRQFYEYRRFWKENTEHFIVSKFPLHLDIESVSVCNLRCPFCATTTKMWGQDKKGYMDFSLFKKIIDISSENGLCAIKLSLRGEPLLHPMLPEMVKYAKKSDIMDVYFNTNAILLNENMIERLIDARLDRISISIEGYKKEFYKKYRVGAKFERLFENVVRLKEIRDRRRSLFPQIRIQTVLFEELKPDFGRYVEFWKDYADEVSYLDKREETKYVEDGKPANWACPFLWQRMTILWDGTILPCLMHGVKDFSSMILGNVADCSIKDLWKGKKENQFRELHKSGKSHEIMACGHCSYRTMEIEKIEGL